MISCNCIRTRITELLAMSMLNMCEDGAQSSSTLMTWLLLLSLALQASLTAAQSGTVIGQDDLAPPYLIFASYSNIYQMYFNETEPRLMLHDPSGGITVVDYHYRMDLVFWMTSGWPGMPSLKQAHLSDGSNMSVLTSYPIENPAGLAVDWINDKVYWADSFRRTIVMYDLATGEKRTVIHLGTGIPIGLGIFPHKDFGWLYTMDKINKLLYRIPVDGNRKDIMRREVICPGTVTLEHRTRSVYWSDVCTFEIQASKIDGSDHSVVVGAQLNTGLVQFSFGLGHYQNTIYWTQQRKLVKYDISLKDRQTLFNSSQAQPLNGLQVVHPSKQPSAEELIQIEMCTIPCENGDCISPGLCACRRGWSGSTCANDVNECATNNGGCSHTCTNLRGSFRCSCPSGLFLQPNGRDCRGFEDTGVNFPNTTNSTTTSSDIPTEPIVFSSSTPSSSFVASPSPTRTQSSFILTTDITIATLTSFSSTIHPSETTFSLAITTSMYSAVSSIIGTYIQSTPQATFTAVPSSPMHSSIYSTLGPISSDNSKHIMTSDNGLDSVVTIVVGLIPNDGIKEGKLDKNATLLVIFASSFGALFILISVIIYLLVVYWRYRQRRKGSYTVQRRRPRDPDTESATSSARSSFRPVSEFYFHYADYNPNEPISQEVVSHGSPERSALVPQLSTRPSVSDSDSSSNNGISETRPLDAKLR